MKFKKQITLKMVGVRSSLRQKEKAKSGLFLATNRNKRTAAQPNSTKVFICKLCGIERSSSIVRHYIHLRSHGLQTISRARHRCTSCRFYFTSPAWLKCHKSKEMRDLMKIRKLRWKLPNLSSRFHHEKSKSNGFNTSSSGRRGGNLAETCGECDYYGPGLSQHVQSVHGLFPPFRCGKCQFKTGHYPSKRLHSRSAHGTNKRRRRVHTWKCAECNEYDGPCLEEHLERVHHLSSPFRCSICPYLATTYCLFKTHRSNQHRVTTSLSNKLTRCMECDEYDGPELKTHLAQAHGMKRPFKCSKCYKSGRSYSWLLQHRKTHESGPWPPNKIGVNIKCEECGEYDGNQVSRHLESVHDLVKPFKCSQCEYSTQFYTNYKSHRASSHAPAGEESFLAINLRSSETKCGECEDYDGPEFYSHLLEAHNMYKPFKCPICGLNVQNYRALQSHRERCSRSAVGERTGTSSVHSPLSKYSPDVIKCAECKEHDGLQIYQHLQNVHKISRPFKCAQCDYMTEFYTNFKTHQGSHWPNKVQVNKSGRSLKCEECDEYDGPERNAHLLDAHGMKNPFLCFICDQFILNYSSFLLHWKAPCRKRKKKGGSVARRCRECTEYDGPNLIEHLKTVHGIKFPFNCRHCTFTSKHYGRFDEHRKLHL